MSTKYVVVNEFQPVGSDNTSSDIHGVFSTWDLAWAYLQEKAIEKGVYLPKDDTQFEVAEVVSYLEFDEYLIVEFVEDEVEK